MAGLAGLAMLWCRQVDTIFEKRIHQVKPFMTFYMFLLALSPAAWINPRGPITGRRSHTALSHVLSYAPTLEPSDCSGIHMTSAHSGNDHIDTRYHAMRLIDNITSYKLPILLIDGQNVRGKTRFSVSAVELAQRARKWSAEMNIPCVLYFDKLGGYLDVNGTFATNLVWYSDDAIVRDTLYFRALHRRDVFVITADRDLRRQVIGLPNEAPGCTQVRHPRDLLDLLDLGQFVGPDHNTMSRLERDRALMDFLPSSFDGDSDTLPIFPCLSRYVAFQMQVKDDKKMIKQLQSVCRGQQRQARQTTTTTTGVTPTWISDLLKLS